MPKLAQKAKALSGKGSVVSYAHEPTKFYFRELIAGTKNYQSQLIKDAETLDEALEKCIDAYTALRQTEKLFGGRAITTYSNHAAVQQVKDKSRIKTKELKICVDEFLKAELLRRDPRHETEEGVASLSWAGRQSAARRGQW